MLEIITAIVAGALSVVLKEVLSVLQETLRGQRSLFRPFLAVYREATEATLASLSEIPFALAKSVGGVVAVGAGAAIATTSQVLAVIEWLGSGIWVRAVSRRHLLATTLIVAGTTSLLMSRYHWLWISDEWWEAFHLNAGVLLVGVGLIDQLVLPSTSESATIDAVESGRGPLERLENH